MRRRTRRVPVSEANYWTNQLDRKLGRRAMLRGAGLLAAGAAGTALAGCGDDNAPAKGTAAAASQPAGTSAAGGASASAAPSGSPVAAPRRGGTLVWPNGGEPSSLDIHKTNNAYSSYYGLGNALS